LHALNRLTKWKKSNKAEIKSWLKAVSEMEAQVSMATYAANHPQYKYPQISASPCFEALSLGHPLISENKAVCNNLNIDQWRYAILTGSNMSGKSTFLKTVGLNILLAQMGLPVFAKALTLYPFRLLTSMKLVDSISKEESYFQAEVLRLKRIKESIGAKRPAFLLLDEILRGTNSEDKRLGTRKFMEQLKTGNDFGILATHDIDVAQLSEKHPQIFRALYFESKVVNSQLTFDYKLREGVCTTPNATDLMRSYGII
jgi:DNA mismatch repair ATPase MutS